MILWRLIPRCLLSIGVAAVSCLAQEGEEEEIDIEALTPGEVNFNWETGLGVATNAFVVRFRDATLTADRGQFDLNSGVILAEGTVTLQRDNQMWRGDRLLYHRDTGILETSDFRTGRWPFYASGQGLTLDFTNQVYTATNAILTSDDVAKPGFKVRARRLTISPGRYFAARDAVLYVGSVPIFYFPYLRRSLGFRVNQINAVPGYRSIYGPFLLGSYEWYWTDRLSGVIHADYRVKRGFAGGLDVSYEGSRLGRSDFRGYYLHDLDAENVDGADGLPAEVPRDRHWLYFSHQSEPATNLTVKAAIREQSDLYVIRDFFESEYRENQQPSSLLELDRYWSNLSLNLVAQPQMNSFFETVERLPDVKLSASRMQLWSLPLYYEGETSTGYLRRRFADGDPGEDYAALRADSFHQLVLPRTLMGWFNVAPRVGGRFTYYGETDTDGPALAERTRWVFNTGAELSFKASRLWPSSSSRFFQVDGIRHILRPAVNYSYVPEPGVRPPELPQFDSELPTLRLLPHWFPDYNAIDSIDSRNVMRLGLRNKLQTKRGGEVDNLLDWDLYTDWRLDREPGQSNFSDVFSDVDLKPWSWLTLTSELRVDVDDPRIRIANHIATLSPNNVWSWQVGHRYLREDPALGFTDGHDLLLSSFYYRLNENWGFRFSHHFEISDQTMEEQYYTVYRDFRSWTGALTFRVRDNRTDSRDYGVAFTFHLKAFPRFKSGADRNKPSLLLGG